MIVWGVGGGGGEGFRYCMSCDLEIINRDALHCEDNSTKQLCYIISHNATVLQLRPFETDETKKRSNF